MLTDKQQKMLSSVFSRTQQLCPYCNLPLYLSDTNLKSVDGTVVDVWECMRDNRVLVVPAMCNVDVLKRLHITIDVKMIGMYGINDVGEHCNTFSLVGYTDFCTLCGNEISSGWELGKTRVCSAHVSVTYKRG